MYSEIFRQIENANKIAIITHNTPDGDAFGSLLLLQEFIKVNYPDKRVFLYTSDYVANDNFESMRNGNELNVLDTNFELVVVVDSASIERIEEFLEIFKNAKSTINIDHHQDNTRYADFNYVEKVSSCSELLFNILLTSDKKINKRMASLACAGMITDTNAFSNPDVTGETFKTVSKLFDFGADVINIRKLFYSGFDSANFKLLGVAKTKAEFYFNDMLMFISLDENDFLKCGVEKDTGCLINQLFAQSTAKACALVTPRNGMKHISLRSVEGLNVNVVAKMLNGGGHICASAGNVDYSDEKIKNIVLSEIEKQLKEYVEPAENYFQ